MEIITSISVIALASMTAILINDYTRFGGRLDDGDDNFSVFARPATVAAVSHKMDEAISMQASEARGSSHLTTTQAQ